MLSYREDNKQLYVNKGNEWDTIGSEKEVSFDVCFFKNIVVFRLVRNKITSGVLRPVRLVGVPFTLADHIDSVDKFADDFKQFTDKFQFLFRQELHFAK